MHNLKNISHVQIFYILFHVSILSACGPSNNELQDKVSTLNDAKLLLENIKKLVPDMNIAEVPGTPWEHLTIYGNYKGRTSTISAYYYSSESAKYLCMTISRYFEQVNMWEFNKYIKKCNVVELDRYLSYGFNARKVNIFNPEQKFLISVGVKEYRKPKIFYVKTWKTIIKIHIHRGKDRRMSRLCIRPNMPDEVQPCRNSIWRENRKKIQ